MDVSLTESPESLNGGRKAHPACEWRHSMVSHTKKTRQLPRGEGSEYQHSPHTACGL